MVLIHAIQFFDFYASKFSKTSKPQNNLSTLYTTYPQNLLLKLLIKLLKRRGLQHYAIFDSLVCVYVHLNSTINHEGYNKPIRLVYNSTHTETA